MAVGLVRRTLRHHDASRQCCRGLRRALQLARSRRVGARLCLNNGNVRNGSDGGGCLLTVSAPQHGCQHYRCLPAPRTQCTRLRLSAPARPSLGDLVFIPKRLWPTYACHEHEGRGWTGRVLSLSQKRSALVAVPFALDDHGRRYVPVRIPHAHVEGLAPFSPRASGIDRARLMMRRMRLLPTTSRGLRSPHSPTRWEWTAAACLPPPRPCTPLRCQGRRA
eukprot:6206832-Pleurochrysis_carterae.AAC.2